ncbi:MAG: hypothetical protein IKD71_06780 [Solobacterium sp.]|nr:hypothetical protein [Solobacterium sp.]
MITTVTPEPVTFNGVTVTVSYPSDAFGGKDVTLVVGEAGAAETAALDARGNAYKAVDISFVDEEGTPVQPAEGKTVSVALKAAGMDTAGDYDVVHVDAEGNIDSVLADVALSNKTTETIKTGETTRTVNIPAETETVVVEDYKEETYTDYETVEKTVEVPAQTGYHYVLKSRQVERVVPGYSLFKGMLKIGGKNNKTTTVTEYYYELEPYVIRAAYTKTVTETVPVTKTRTVLAGTHEETRTIKEAYAYEVTEDVFEDVTRNDVEAAFDAASFSVYAIVAVGDDGSLDFDETYGADHITVKAPAGAFEAGTIMKIETVDDPEILANALKALDDNTYSIYGIDISFWKDGAEVEPALPVRVTWTSSYINAGDTLVHINDDGTAEKVDNVLVKEDRTVFTTDKFSTYTTTRIDTIDLTADYAQAIVFDGISAADRPATMNSGTLASTHPVIDGYTYVDATYQRQGEAVSTDHVIYLGAFIYREFEDDGTTQIGTDKIYIYYRTEAAADNDLIVQLADNETIHLNYEATPVTVTYRVEYGGTTYTLDGNELPAALVSALGDDADALIVNGPTSVKQNTNYSQAITVDIPRGYSATITRGTTTVGRLGESTEPTYSLDNNNKIITKNGTLSLKDTYDIPRVNSNQTVTITLTKRNSFTFNARWFLATVYAGGAGNSTNTLGDRRINANRAAARVTSDAGTIGTSGNTAGTGTISDNTYTWSFWTNLEVPDDIASPNDRWMVDALEINGTSIEIPYAETLTSGAVSKTTTLPTGTQITVTLDQITNSTGGTGKTRHYTITVSNAYENVVISGGNIVNAASSTEIIAEVLDNVTFQFYGFSTADDAYNNRDVGWKATDGWGVGEPISVGGSSNGTATSGAGTYNMYVFSERNNNAMRFSIPDGYYNPEIAFVSTEETDLIANVTLGSGLSRGTKTDGYYPISGNPTNGYYYFRITGIGGEHVALLRIRASLKRCGVSYDAGEVTGATIPAYDYGGWYDDAHEQLQGYNVEDNTYVVVDKAAPTAENYVFLYYTIDGDTSANPAHYSPSQKIALEDIAEYGVYDDTKGEFVIPFVAHWEEKATSENVVVTAHIFLDDEDIEDVHTTVPEHSSIYIDIDSETMTEIMDDYNWQLFYDETGSSPFISDVTEENNEVTLRLYSKFYVYHSATGTLELHTTKEMEYQDGTDAHGNPILKIGTLDITKLTKSGYLYGGYYMDYAGAHEGNAVTGKNLVKAAADWDNNNGTLTTQNIQTLHDGGSVAITKDGTGAAVTTHGTPYNPAATAAHSTYWTLSDAFTATTKTIAADSGWYSDRGTIDTAALTTGGVGTTVKIARAGIYYIKEVPANYLKPTYMTTYQRWDKYLRDFILISTTDDQNYTDAGFVIGATYTTKEYFTKTLDVTFGPNYDETVTDGKVTLAVTNTSANAGGYVVTKRIFSVNESTKDYSWIIGSKVYKPYWVTPDGITVTGAAMRAFTVKDKDGDTIIKVVPVTPTGGGAEVNEITFNDFSTPIKAQKR